MLTIKSNHLFFIKSLIITLFYLDFLNLNPFIKISPSIHPYIFNFSRSNLHLFVTLFLNTIYSLNHIFLLKTIMTQGALLIILISMNPNLMLNHLISLFFTIINQLSIYIIFLFIRIKSILFHIFLMNLNSLSKNLKTFLNKTKIALLILHPVFMIPFKIFYISYYQIIKRIILYLLKYLIIKY